MCAVRCVCSTMPRALYAHGILLERPRTIKLVSPGHHRAAACCSSVRIVEVHYKVNRRHAVWILKTNLNLIRWTGLDGGHNNSTNKIRLFFLIFRIFFFSLTMGIAIHYTILYTVHARVGEYHRHLSSTRTGTGEKC